MNRFLDADIHGLHLAHLGKTGNQLLSEHLSGVAGRCSALAKKLGLPDPRNRGFAVKDLCYTEGVRTMGGTAVLREFVSPSA